MSNPVNTELVWEAIAQELFAVLGMVTEDSESRTVGIVYLIHDQKFFIGTGSNSWKTRHILKNKSVSMTIPIAKRVPVAPWIKIPQATITFSGKAKVIPGDQAPADLLKLVFRHKADDKEFVKDNCLIEVTPEGDFITYGVGIPLMKMRHPEQSRGRASVS